MRLADRIARRFAKLAVNTFALILVVITLTMPAAADAETRLQSHLEVLREAKGRLESAHHAHEKAEAWLAFQVSVEQLVKALPKNTPFDVCEDENTEDVKRSCPGADIVMQARKLGAHIYYNGAGEAYGTTDEGWRKYLEHWPDGPNADEAWWHVNVEPKCTDECSTEAIGDPAESDAMRYAEFIERFPNSKLRSLGERRIKEFAKVR